MTARTRTRTGFGPRRARIAGVALSALVLVLGAGGCSDGTSSRADRAPEPTPIAAPSGLGPDGEQLTLEVVDGGETTGLVMTDHRGFAVYGVTGERTDGAPVCVDECLQIWVPVPPRDASVAAALDLDLYTVYTRADGTEQASYAGIPLYLWTGDREIGITGGAGVAGTWFALTEAAGFIE